jgi:phosphatidylinositol glycan class S
MGESKAQQLLSIESRSSLLQRRWVLFSILALYLFIGVPLWFRLTEIYRAPLPANFIQTLHRNGNVDIKLTNRVYLKVGDGFRYPDLAEATQIQINHELHRLQQDPETAMSVLWNVTVQLQDEIPHDSYVLYLELGGAEGISLDETKKEATLFYTLDSVKNNDLPFFVTQTILYHMFNTEMKLLSPRHDRGINALRYSPNIHLSFKLLSGDGYPVDWEIEKTLDNYFKPLVQEFKSFINFTVDSEIKYYTELNLPEGSHQINKNELSTILDFSEWDISSNQFSYPTLNFVLYYPSASQAPLEFTDQSSQYYSFLIPQWGSVLLKESALIPNTVIGTRELEPLLETFTSELFKLLGIPGDPKTPKIRIDAMKKYSILENLNRGVDSLSSLLKLSESLPNMSIPKTVLENVKAALESRQRVVQKLNFEYDFDGALVESISMLQHAESAFFDREMVQQTFFPQEHKIAVYMPLLGPMTLICVMGTIRVLKEIKLIKKKRD